MAEFAIDSSVNDSTSFAPFELTYGAMPRIFQATVSTPFFGVKSFAEKALTNLVITHDSIIENRTFQTHHADKYRSAEEPLKEGDLVYLISICRSIGRGNYSSDRNPLSKANPDSSGYAPLCTLESVWNASSLYTHPPARGSH